MSSLDNVVRVHAKHCDCNLDIRMGVIQVGDKCKAERQSFLAMNRMRPKHTAKTRACNKNRLLRRYHRAKWANDRDKDSLSAFKELLSNEYMDQREKRGQYSYNYC